MNMTNTQLHAQCGKDAIKARLNDTGIELLNHSPISTSGNHQAQFAENLL